MPDLKPQMCSVVIFGNSGSGKSSLAKRLSRNAGLAHLDLDEIAWKESDPPIREDAEKCIAGIDEFIGCNPNGWIIEGCYSSLIAHAAQFASEMVFLNPGVDVCVENCKRRPWEPDKYTSKDEQDDNLEMLIEWIRTYSTRDDEFSLREHRRLFASFVKAKVEICSNPDAAKFVRFAAANVSSKQPGT